MIWLSDVCCQCGRQNRIGSLRVRNRDEDSPFKGERGTMITHLTLSLSLFFFFFPPRGQKIEFASVLGMPVFGIEFICLTLHSSG